jgi:hypothetical protein
LYFVKVKLFFGVHNMNRKYKHKLNMNNNREEELLF